MISGGNRILPAREHRYNRGLEKVPLGRYNLRSSIGLSDIYLCRSVDETCEHNLMPDGMHHNSTTDLFRWLTLQTVLSIQWTGTHCLQSMLIDVQFVV